MCLLPGGMRNTGLFLMGYLWTTAVVVLGTHHATLCKMIGEGCTREAVPRHLLNQIELPPLACAIHKCAGCITTYESYVLTPDFELITPKTFILRSDNLEPEQNNFNTTFYKCLSPQGTPCSCATNACNGPQDFCNTYNCSESPSCTCHLTHGRATWLHVGEDRTIENPTIINIQVCMFRRKRTQGRRLMEAEQATFTRNNLTITFIDPVLTLPDNRGRLILRTNDYETLITVRSRHVTVPFELLAHKTILTAIFITDNGLSIDAEIVIQGKKICRVTGCVFCKENFQSYKCWQPFFRKTLWAIIIFLIMISLIMIRIIVKTMTSTILLVLNLLWLIFRLVRLAFRFCLLLGSAFGDGIRRGCTGLYDALEQRDLGHGVAPRAIVLAALAMCLLAEGTHASCTDYAIVKSELKLCEHRDAYEETCKLTTSAEVTLKNIHHETCLWFHSKDQKPLFSVKITFCLEEPSIELLQLQGKSLEQTARSTHGSIFEWVHFPMLNSALFMLKLLGAALLAIGLLITLISTLITCCCRRK